MDATQVDPRARRDAEPPEATPSTRRLRRGSRGRRGRGRTRAARDLGFGLAAGLLIIVSLATLARIGAALESGASGPRPVARPPAATSAPQPARAVVRRAHVRIYALPQPNAGLMQPAADARGDLWVGAMGTNRLLRLDARTGAVDAWEPPGGRNGIMQTAIDAAGRVWFAEQNADYIGRFDPATRTFATYPLGTANGHGMGPQDLQFDAAGRLWFTELTGGRIGRLDPATGAIDSWPLPPPAPGVPPYPFGLAVTPAGQVWFGYLGGGAVGRLEPGTGRAMLSHLADPQAQVFSMAADARGHVWFTELEAGKLGTIDTATGGVSELAVPPALGTTTGLYEVAAVRDGSIWFPVTSANALVRYAPDSGTFTFYELSVPASVPYGLST